MIQEFINGICMALADSVPGVSGGTVAFVMGFYDKFIGSINDLVYEKGSKRKNAIIYLLKLGIGWISGMAAAMLVLSSVFESHIYLVSSLFMGFIIISLPIIILEEKESIVGKYKNILFSIIGIMLVVYITLMNQGKGNLVVNLTSINLPIAIYLFIAGVAAISAMFLPGISGSTLLLIFGLYMPIISGVKDILHFNFASFPAIVIFGIGIIAGALLAVKGIKLCLEKFRSQTVYMIIGLMIGSLYSIAMGPTTLESPVAALSLSNFNFIACIVGVIIVFSIQWIGKKKIS